VPGVGHRDAAREHAIVTGPLSHRLIAETLGTTFLLAAVVGSGIMADRLFPAQQGLALLANSLATGAALLALIHTFGPVSGAHFNPVVTLAQGTNLPRRAVAGYLAAQLVGAVLGVWMAHAMFGERVFMLSHHARSGAAQWFSELIATFGLVAVITGCSRRRPEATPVAVAAYILAAYWFTASTSFANPAVTIARALTDTFAGIRPADVPAFIIAQVLGGMSAAALLRWLTPAALDPSRGSVPLVAGSAAQ
jgi:glycerol uptake facilitator-like aquaporin